MSERCDALYEVVDVTLACTRNAGHDGVHLAPFAISGQRCDVGWRDDYEGASRAASAAPQETNS